MSIIYSSIWLENRTSTPAAHKKHPKTSFFYLLTSKSRFFLPFLTLSLRLKPKNRSFPSSRMKNSSVAEETLNEKRKTHLTYSCRNRYVHSVTIIVVGGGGGGRSKATLKRQNSEKWSMQVTGVRRKEFRGRRSLLGGQEF